MTRREFFAKAAVALGTLIGVKALAKDQPDKIVHTGMNAAYLEFDQKLGAYTCSAVIQSWKSGPVPPYIQNTGKGAVKFRYRGGRIQTLHPGEWFNCEKGDFHFLDDTPPYLHVITGDGITADFGGTTFSRAVPIDVGAVRCGNP